MKRMTSLAAGVLAVLSATAASAHSLNPAVVEALTGEKVQVHAEETPVDPRGEERTFASFPEWYIVYSAQEYGSFVRFGGWPSQFPYFGAVRQYWESVGHAKKALGGKEIDSSTRTVLNVIGASFSVESAVIGLYEQTVGRTTEYLNFRVKTAEDAYVDAVAKEYGDFLLHTPWYEFPYFRKLAGLWTTYGWSSVTPRGLERRAAFTVGYAIKGVYGGVLGWLSKSSLGSAELETSFVVKNIDPQTLAGFANVRVLGENADGSLNAVAPRYRAFTDTAHDIVFRGGEFVTIQGHSAILFTAVGLATVPCLSGLSIPFSMPILTDPTMRRYAVYSDVTYLDNALKIVDGCANRAEHIYDY